MTLPLNNYTSVIFEGATLVHLPNCNAKSGCHINAIGWIAGGMI